MTNMPERIAKLPRDPRGYPIPYNVARGVDGTPLFTVNDSRTHMQCLCQGLCPICGETLGKWKWFVGGPRSAFEEHGWYIDLPGHAECEKFALQTCPYLAAPRYLGRIDIVPEKLPGAAILIDETQIPGRPDFFVAVAGDRVEISAPPEPGLHLPYVRPVRPFLEYEFWQHGQQIPVHRAMPILRGLFGADWKLPATAV